MCPKANNLIAAGFAVVGLARIAERRAVGQFWRFPLTLVRHPLCGSYDFSGSLHGILHSDPPDVMQMWNSGGVSVGAGLATEGHSIRKYLHCRE